jgi:zinc finger protein 830
MSDVRALLKAKRQEIQIRHPLASYSANGELRCLACKSVVKHASAWEGHLGSKAHRTNVAHMKEQEQLRHKLLQEEEEKERPPLHGKKRREWRGSAQRTTDESDEERTPKRREWRGSAKRTTDESDEERTPKRSRRDEEADETRPIALPSDFFSDPSQAPPSLLPSADGDADMTPLSPVSKQTAMDLEWENFKRNVLEAPIQPEIYESATISAEPELLLDPNEGFPSLDGEQASSSNIDEEGVRRKKEQDEVRYYSELSAFLLSKTFANYRKSSSWTDCWTRNRLRRRRI